MENMKQGISTIKTTNRSNSRQKELQPTTDQECCLKGVKGKRLWPLSEMRRISENNIRIVSSWRYFVSAILSLISILISPVLSTDAMWNVITDATGTGLETSMVNPAWLANFASLTAGPTYLFRGYTSQPDTNA